MHLTTTHSGTLSSYPKTWIGAGGIAHTLTGNVTVPSGVTLTIKSGATVYLNSYSIISTGGAIVQNGNVIPDIRLMTGSSLKGFYPSISNAANAALSGEKVVIMNSLSLTADETFKNGVILEVASNKVLSLAGHKITTSSGSFTLAAGSVVDPLIRRTSGGNLVGLHPTPASAINDASSGQTILLKARVAEYPGAFNMKSGVCLMGEGRDNTSILGNVTFNYVSNAELSGVYLKGVLLINGGANNCIGDIYLSNILDINGGSGLYIENCRHQSQSVNSYLDIYGAGVTAINYENCSDYPTYGVQGGYANLTMEGGQLRKFDYGLRVGSGLTADLYDVTLCQNTWDILAHSGGTTHLTDVIFSACPPPIYSLGGSVTWNTCTVCTPAKAAYDPSTYAVSSEEDDSPDALLLKEAKKQYQVIQKAFHGARKNGEKKERKEYQAEYNSASQKLHKIVSNYPESQYVSFALQMLSFIGEELGESADFIAWAEKELSKAKIQTLECGLQQALVHASVASGQFEKAIAYSDILAETSADLAQVESALYGKGVIYQYFLGDKEKATQAYNEAIASNPQSQYAEAIAIDLAREGGKVGEKPVQQTETDSEGFSLENYPNPANPTTTIVYTLPEATDILVQVFDVRGRLVQTLVNGMQESGRHTVLWNGADDKGIAASSGMYFCRLNAGEKVLTRKMLLVR